jgi:hypothetical protein
LSANKLLEEKGVTALLLLDYNGKLTYAIKGNGIDLATCLAVMMKEKEGVFELLERAIDAYKNVE